MRTSTCTRRTSSARELGRGACDLASTGSSVHRYYDPVTAQFVSVDPALGVTGQPYAYAGGDPVNGVDPTGMFGWSDVGHTLNAMVSQSLPARIAQAVTNATGLTMGGCAGGSYFGGPALNANLCWVATPSGQTGFTFSLGGGGGGPLGVNALLGPVFSNAQNLCDLRGGFGYGEGSVGEYVFGGGTQGSIGNNRNNRAVWTAEGGWAPALRTPVPIPFTGGGGGSFTWVLG